MSYPQQIRYSVKPNDNLYQLSKHFKTNVPKILALNPQVDPYNLQVGSTLLIQPGEEYGMMQPGTGRNPSGTMDAAKQMRLSNQMRLVWSQHVYWTRMLLISLEGRLKDLEATQSRLMENPNDIAAVFGNYYPPAASQLISQLLNDHLQIGGELIVALRDGNTARAQDLNRQWYQNADEMAAAFASLNPYYNEVMLRQMLHRHLELTSQEVQARLQGDYPADVKAFDNVEQEALRMADDFSAGIMKQFPQKFETI